MKCDVDEKNDNILVYEEDVKVKLSIIGKHNRVKIGKSCSCPGCYSDV